MTRDTLDLLLRNIEPPRGRAWHGGVTVVGALRNVDAREAHRVPRGGRHSIWSLALHLAYWKYAVRRHLVREPIPRFPRSPANWPAVPRRADEALWQADRALVAEEHRRFVAAAAALDPARLTRRPPRKKTWTYGELIAGILAHDAYHVGQIQLLKRLGRG